MTTTRTTSANSPGVLAFWQEHQYATLTTLRPDGTPHVVPVSVTYEPNEGTESDTDPGAGTTASTAPGSTGDPDTGGPGTGAAPAGGGAGVASGTAGLAGTARVVSMRTSKKVRNIAAAGADGMRVALCQLEKGRWSTLEGRARIRTDAAAVSDAEERYEMRYGRRPRPNPERVLIEIAVDRVLASPALERDA